MQFRVVIIDEPIHVSDKFAGQLWQQSLWIKEQGYRRRYSNSILPVSTDDFFATHLIVAHEKSDGTMEPALMHKSVRRSQCKRFGVPFPAETLLHGTKFESATHINNILDEPTEISYEGSMTINPKFITNPRICYRLREYLTLFFCNHHLSINSYRWISAGVTRFKIDNYLEWLGGTEVLSAFELPIIDNGTVRMIYMPDVRHPSPESKAIADKYSEDWDNRIVFSPASFSYTDMANAS